MTSRVSPASLVRPWDSAGRMRTLSQLLSSPLCSPETGPTEENTKRNVSLHLVWEMPHVLGRELWLGMYLCLVEGMVLIEVPPHELSTARVTMEHHRNSAPSRAGISNPGQHQNASECCSPFQSHLSGLGWGLNELLPWRKHLLAQAINHCLAVTLMHRKYTTCGFKQ